MAKNFQSEKYSYAVYFQKDLNRHVQIIHEGIKKYSYEKCEKAFESESNVRQHILFVHEGMYTLYN